MKTLHAALDKAREDADLSWRALAKEIGVNASTISRMQQGLKPDVNAFAAMTTWLRMDAEKFYLAGDDDPGTSDPAPLMSELTVLLRARPDLPDKNRSYLEDVIEATLRRFESERTEDGL
ncbi:helix-turn-helix transcriptional regulator [Nocardioides sp. WS12]|uniref:helix-turn-helix transcriptional regulator n=1 Tax=Nocardioides sp. WS12 TaxID=2486272 RepID=UPI00191EE8AC|nr:helix-turn-helix transcriptional regulator [Nocardioides sp. WS12]